ncbi:mycofactocin-coupled SDR family oxidoreductase [Nocardioides sp. dk4132]|uniref:mycofactocin-coupled SDR family oxidoreductase n=1 Tax=unclassified Nocardioides TaxID=2615069 RepID=UPI0012949E20|nr:MULTISPECIES: mycofactocin-coupled SDR family oxidoreductase [unclassified Nocardioides]MQW77620.1 mycofactocin-coupled SDR family oxidoreductase [Nocardioides sp. dk4132]QGA06146.1 mycofactocin-coupled SDR family oxidoreductase [Nocardioides sp. dk884]
MRDVVERQAGKVAFITGAARGMGRAHAERLAAEGANLILIDSCQSARSTGYPGGTEEELEETAELARKYGAEVLSRKVDIRDWDGIEQVVADGVAELGRLDVVVANAGICFGDWSWKIGREDWQEMIDTNLTGTFATVKPCVPIMIDQGTGGSIIITSSVAGLRGQPFLGAYVASKHGVTGLAKTMAVELAQYNIRVNTVHPHGVETGMAPPVLHDLIVENAATLGPIFMGSLPDPVSQPEDIAGAVAFLASDEARHITGTQLQVDLGTLIR